MTETGRVDPPGSALVLAAPAKINLYLHVIGRRDDGYHLLDTLIAFAGVQDTISLRLADTVSLTVTGEFSGSIPAGEDNLVFRAARALAVAANISSGAAISLTKRLPPASGMGGGSADAAAVLRGLVQLWEVDLPPRHLMDIALGLGADVPMCLAGKAAFARGIGDDLATAPQLPPAWVVLVNPGVAVSTPDVFAARTGGFSAPAEFSYPPEDAGELAALMRARRNDLTPAAITLAPVIGDVLAAIEACPGHLLARMTGSGATCFGLFADADAAMRASLAVAGDHPGWWVKAASLESDALRLDR